MVQHIVAFVTLPTNAWLMETSNWVLTYMVVTYTQTITLGSLKEQFILKFWHLMLFHTCITMINPIGFHCFFVTQKKVSHFGFEPCGWVKVSFLGWTISLNTLGENHCLKLCIWPQITSSGLWAHNVSQRSSLWLRHSPNVTSISYNGCREEEKNECFDQHFLLHRCTWHVSWLK